MGIFGRNIKRAYDTPGVPTSIASPYSSQDSLVTLPAELIPAELRTGAVVMTPEVALTVPAVDRAHGVHVGQFAENPFFMMDGDVRAAVQPRWTYTSDSGVAPYQRWSGLGSDFFFQGWGCLSFTADAQDCIHVPWGKWGQRNDGTVWVDPTAVPDGYAARPIAIPVGGTWRGLLNTARRTIDQAMKIENAYQQRLDNPVPLTFLGIPRDVYESWSDDEIKAYRDAFVDGRKGINGATAVKIAEFPIDMPGQVAVDLYETGRNGSRLDVANATATPADLLEGAKQGGSGGTTMRYQGVGEGGTARSDLWDFGLAKRFTLAVEARLSLDDVVPAGFSIRADRTAAVASPAPATNPTSED